MSCLHDDLADNVIFQIIFVQKKVAYIIISKSDQLIVSDNTIGYDINYPSGIKIF